MNLKKWICLTLSAVAVCSAMAGCGGNANKGNQFSMMSDAVAVLYGFDDIDDAIAEQRSKIESGRLKDTKQNRILIDNTEILRDWAEEKGVSVTSKDWGWGDKLTQKLMAAFMAEETPDVIMGETQMPGFAQEGYLEPFPEDLAAFVRTNVSPLAYEAMEFDGKIYGISLTPGISLLVWNKDILSKAKIDPRIIDEGPASWTEWEATMAKVKAAGYNAGGVYVGNGGVNYGALFRAGTLMASAGGTYADESGSPKFNTDQNKLALEFLRRQKTSCDPNMLTPKEESSYFSYFNNGKMAYKVDGIWSLYEAETYKLNVGYALMPTPDGTGDRTAMLMGVGYSAVPVYAKNKELAWDAIRLLLDERIQSNIAKGGHRQPVLKSVIDTVYDETDADWYKPYMADYKMYAQFAVENSIKGLPSFYMEKGKISDLWGAVGNALTLTVTENTDIARLLENAQSAMAKEWAKG